MIILAVLFGGIFLLLIMGVSIYNGLVNKKNLMEEGWSSIDVFLKKRNDLIPNLMETVKGYASHEKELLENVTKSRNLAQNANSVADHEAAESGLKNAMLNLFAITESYPDLKANQNFIEMQNELSAIGYRNHFNRTRNVRNSVWSFVSGL